MKRFGKNLIHAAVPCAAVIALLFGVTACKQFTADINEELGYWAAEAVVDRDIVMSPNPAYASGSSIPCVPSASDVTVTMKVRNPKNFSFVMPGTPGSPTDIVRFGDHKVKGSGGAAKPVYGTDYTLVPTPDGKALKLTYTDAFLKANEHSRANIGASIKLYSTDGRKFNQNYKFDLEANTPPQLEYVTIGKTAVPDAQGKYYYVIILKAEDMTETGGTPSGLLHKDIKTLSVTGGDSADIAFTPGNTGFFVDTGVPVADRRLLAANEVVPLASDEGPTPPSDWSTLNSDPWALRYKTNIVVKAASKTYTFRLTDKKGLSSTLISASTSETKAQDAQLFDGTTEISGTGELSPYSMNAELSAASVSVTAQTTTVGAKITGRLEKPNDSSWVPRTIDSGSWTSVAITLPAPIPDQEALYKITVAAGGDGFVPGTEKVFYVKVTKNTTISINPADNTTWGGQPSAWDALKATVESGSARVIIVDGRIEAPGQNKQIKVNRTVKIMGKTGTTNDILDADNQTFIFDIWPNGNLSLEKLTLQNGKNTDDSVAKAGGAIYCSGGKLKTDDVIIEECTAKNGGGIYAKNVAGTPEIKLKNTKIIKCKADRFGGAIYVTDGGSLTLDNATIGGTAAQANKAVNGNGGGIYLSGNGTTGTMTGGEISFNEAAGSSSPRGGGGCIEGLALSSGTHASFTLNGGTIKNNLAAYGGGVMANNGGVFIMKGGTISFNTATEAGAGVNVHGAMTMTGGTIEQNTCTTTNPNSGGGGIALSYSYTNQITLNMTGGTISGNTVNSLAKGAGVWVKAGTEVTMKMSGAAKIDTNNDVYLQADKTIILTGKLSPAGGITARITPESYPTTSKPNIQVLQNPAGNTTNVVENYFKFTVTPYQSKAFCVNEAGLIRQQVDTSSDSSALTQNWTKLKNAIENANDNDVIYIRDDCHAPNDSATITVNKKITLIGLTSDQITLNALSECRIFIIENGGNFTIKNMKLERGNAQNAGGNGGGAILLKSGGSKSLTLENVSIEHCYNSKSGWSHGAGIAIYGGTVTMKDKAKISLCETQVSGRLGGGVYIGSGGTLNIDGSTGSTDDTAPSISFCKADKGGGVYIASGGILNLKKGRIYANSVKDNPKKGIAVFNANSNANTFNWSGGKIMSHNAGQGSTVIEGPCNNTSGNDPS